MQCPFCKRIIAQNKHSFAIHDAFLVALVSLFINLCRPVWRWLAG